MPNVSNEDLKSIKNAISEYAKSKTANCKAKEIHTGYINCKKKLKVKIVTEETTEKVVDELEQIITDTHNQSVQEWEGVLDDAGRWGITKGLKIAGKYIVSALGGEQLLTFFPQVKDILASLKKFVQNFFKTLDEINLENLFEEEENHARILKQQTFRSPKRDLSGKLFREKVVYLTNECSHLKAFFAEYAIRKKTDLGSYFNENTYIEKLPITSTYIRILAGIAGIKSKDKDSKDDEYYEKDLFGTGFLGILFARLYHILLNKFYGVNMPEARLKYKPTKTTKQQSKRPDRHVTFAESAEFKEYEIGDDEFKAQHNRDQTRPLTSTRMYNLRKFNADRKKQGKAPVDSIPIDPDDAGYVYGTE